MIKGSAYVFAKPTTANGWADTILTETAKLTASDGAANDEFGISVAVSGGTIVVGAPVDESDEGSAYVFVKRSRPLAGLTVTAPAKLTASDGAANDEFGTAVAVDGDTIVVGAPGDDSGKGSGYVFVKPGTGWATENDTDTETAKLTAFRRRGEGRVRHFRRRWTAIPSWSERAEATAPTTTVTP